MENVLRLSYWEARFYFFFSSLPRMEWIAILAPFVGHKSANPQWKFPPQGIFQLRHSSEKMEINFFIHFMRPVQNWSWPFWSFVIPIPIRCWFGAVIFWNRLEGGWEGGIKWDVTFTSLENFPPTFLDKGQLFASSQYFFYRLMSKAAVLNNYNCCFVMFKVNSIVCEAVLMWVFPSPVFRNTPFHKSSFIYSFIMLQFYFLHE